MKYFGIRGEAKLLLYSRNLFLLVPKNRRFFEDTRKVRFKRFCFRFRMRGIYPESEQLKNIIESHDWVLYDLTEPADEKRAFGWGEVEKSAPARQFEVGHNYLFVPKAKAGQTKQQAYSVTNGLGPSLTIENLSDERWEAADVRTKEIGLVALFSRLFFYEDHACAMTPTPSLMDSDFVAMDYDKLADTFSKYFRIVRPEEFGKTPIPMPHDPLRN